MPIFRAEDIRDDLHLTADAVVVGSGAGGAVAAHELAARGYDVVLLERGGYYITSDFKSDPQWAFEHLYAHRGVTPTLGIPPVLIPYGECVGGSTVINSGTVFRTPARIFDRWRDEHRVEGLETESLNTWYSYIEQKIGATESVWPALGEYNRVLERGVKALGLKGGPLVRNAPHCMGCGVCVFGCPTGAKQSMLVTFVPAADALGVRVYAEAAVDRVRIENGRAVGVEGNIVDRATGRVRARLRVDARVTIVAAGTFGSPVLLAASDVPDRGGHIGRNLKVHPAGGAIARMADDVFAWRAIPQGYKVDQWADDGIMLEGAFGPPEVISLLVPGFGAELQERMAAYKRLVSFGLMVEDRDSTGSVTGVRNRAPIIRYQLGKDDKRRLLFGWKKVMEILFAAGAEEVYPSIRGFDVFRSATQIQQVDEKAVSRSDLTLSAYHPMGTCRMGRDPENAVVDSFLEVHGTRRLFVTDASVFPTALGVNPQATIMTFAARTADYLHRNRETYFRAS